MRNTINQRIRLLMEHYNYNANSLSLELGYKGSTTLNNIISGKLNKPSFDVLIRLIEVFNEVSLEWLLLGDGEMLKDNFSIEQHRSMLENNELYKEHFYRMVNEEALKKLNDTVNNKKS